MHTFSINWNISSSKKRTYPIVDSGQILTPSSLSLLKLSAASIVVKSGSSSRMTTCGALNSSLLTSTAASLSPIKLALLEQTKLFKEALSVTLSSSISGTKNSLSSSLSLSILSSAWLGSFSFSFRRSHSISCCRLRSISCCLLRSFSSCENEREIHNWQISYGFARQ